MTQAMTGDTAADDQLPPEPIHVDPLRDAWLHHQSGDVGRPVHERMPFWSTFALFVMMLILCNLIAAMGIGFWVVSTATPYNSLFWNDAVVWAGINIVAVSLSVVIAISTQRRQ